MAYRLSAKRLALGIGPCPQLPGHGGDSELVMTSYHQRITATESCERKPGQDWLRAGSMAVLDTWVLMKTSSPSVTYISQEATGDVYLYSPPGNPCSNPP